jgi:LacI family transcriptional regulator
MASIRIREIARELNISPGTVSKALQGKSNLVSRATAEKILNHCQAQGYMSKSDVDRILFKMQMHVAANKQIYVLAGRSGIEFYDTVFSGICEQMQDNGMVSSLFLANDAKAMHRFPYDQAGVVIVLGKADMEVIKQLSAKKVPMVMVDNRLQNFSASAVNSNNLEAVRQAVRLLVERGHQRIVFSCMHEDQPSVTFTFHERQAGYTSEMAAQGLFDESLLLVDYAADYQKGRFEQRQAGEYLRQHCSKLFTLDPLPTAVITANDLHAYVLRELLTERGLRVPDDISIIGYDGQHHLSALSPHHFDPVSTMVVQWREMGDPKRPVRYVELPAEFEDAGTVRSF